MEKLEEDMKPKLIGETWRKYPTEKSSQLVTYGLFECQYCGKEWECPVSNVKRGNTKSCGCLVGKNTTHGLKSNRFYQTWYGMLQRCTNLKSKDYKDYGARGITVCEEWQDVRNFVDWAEKTYPNIEGYTLDRIDNDKGYSPENCRFVTHIENALSMKKINLTVEDVKFIRSDDFDYSMSGNYTCSLKVLKDIKESKIYKNLE